MVPDFSGYATRSGVKCTDGRTILAHAFKEMDGVTVPLVYQHQHDNIDNVLGHAILHAVSDGVRVDAFFNDTPSGQKAKAQVIHRDLRALSIYANNLVQKGMEVVHGVIREVSLVLAGANPGAYIDNVNLAHGDGATPFDDEAYIYNGFNIELPDITHADNPDAATDDKGDNSPDGDTDSDDMDVDAIIASMNDQQRAVFEAAVGVALQQSDTDNNDKKGDAPVTRNVFDDADKKTQKPAAYTLSHSDIKSIFADAQRPGATLKSAAEDFALAHGIDDISTLFPYDQAVQTTPEFISRRMEWVQGVLSGVRKTPFSRIRSMTADITQDEARAKGYITGNLKKEEFIRIARRITTPTTIYKKQSLDRDDIIDITDFDVVAWLQTEMRLMLDEELAAAILFGDGRDPDDDDKINADNIRPILTDDTMYVTTVNISLSGDATADDIVDGVVSNMRYFRGTGTPVMYTTRDYIAQMKLVKDTTGRRIYNNLAEIADAMGVSAIIPVERMEAIPGLIGIIVNLQDYTVGADKGGQVSLFDFFDIDYNKNKYLIETRCSGAMTKYKGALVIMEDEPANGFLEDPTPVTFVASTGVATIPTVAHVSYVTVADDGTESDALTAGAQTAVAGGITTRYRAKAASGYAFTSNGATEWSFTSRKPA